MVLPAFAFAQDAVQSLATITVQADSQESYAGGKFKKKADLGSLGIKSVIDTPFSFARYSDQLIQDQQAATTSEVLRNDPGIRETTNAGHLNENVQIRGFAVGFEDYNINGLFGMAPTGRIPTEILDSVTLLKGPTALTTGMPPTGSVGGVVMAQTKRATKDLTQVSAMYEDGGYYKSGFDVSRRFGENREFGARVSGSYGQGEHIIDGMEDQNATGVVALDYTTDKVKVNFDAYAVRDHREDGSPAMVSMGTINQVIAARSGDTNYFPNIEGRQNSKYAGLSGEYKFNPDFKVFGGFGYAQKEYAGHLFGTRMILTDTAGNATTQYYRVGSKENNFAGNAGFEGKFETGTIKHTVGLRVDYLNRKYSQHAAATSSSFKTNLYNTDLATVAYMPTAYPNIIPYADNDYLSYTLSDQISMLDDKLQLILAARYQDIHTRNLYKHTSYSSNKTSPSVGIVIKPFGDNLSFYANYIEGLSEGKDLSDTTYATDVNYKKTFAPYQTKQYEIGAKYQYGSWLNTLALFQIEKPELVTETFAITDPRYIAKVTTQETTDDGQTRSRGIEWAFSGNLTRDLSVMGNLAYIDAKYTKTSSATTQGKTVYGVPDVTARLSFDYKIPMLEGLSANAGATYVSEQYLNSTNTLELSDYTIFDLGAKYQTKLGGVDTTFRATLDNLANKKYWVGVFNSNYAIIGEARTYKLGVTFDF